MDVSIAVSLIRGQMGTVVERAVNTAVETVLAEMLKVVGVKFEELKAEVVLMKRDVVALQRENAMKEKETDNIRAKLRYTELKLKYYRQGVEEELQQRAATSTLVRIHPSSFPRTQRDRGGVSPSCSAQGRTAERSHQVPECTSSQSSSRRAVKVSCPADVASSDLSDLLLPVSLAVTTPAEPLDDSADQDAAQSQDQVDECKWTISLQPHTEGVDAAVAPPLHALTLDEGHQSAADSSMLPSSAPQVKQEAQPQQEEEEEVICIKEEPEEEQEVMATLLLDCKVQQGHPSESEGQRSLMEWSRLPAGQMTHTAFSAAGPNSYLPPQLAASQPSVAALPPGVPPRQAVRPWTKDLSLYEEYKLRRNELRRRNLSRRRELEKTLPQPLLADLVRERREKTRLRVARWRAKRKLQAFLNQTQAHGGAAGLSQSGFPINSQQQLTAPSASGSAAPPSSSFLSNSISAILPLIPTSSSSLLLRGPSMAPHEHTVTSSSSYPQVSLSDV